MMTAWDDALAQMKLALETLDASGAPSDIGAHLDLAIRKLEELAASQRSSEPAERTTLRETQTQHYNREMNTMGHSRRRRMQCGTRGGLPFTLP